LKGLKFDIFYAVTREAAHRSVVKISYLMLVLLGPSAAGKELLEALCCACFLFGLNVK
jgi:hypothetical protein